MLRSLFRFPSSLAAPCALLLLPLLAACAPLARGSAGVSPPMYVLNGTAGTVQALKASTGRPRGAAIPVRPSPISMVAAPGGGLLLLSREDQLRAGLTLLPMEGEGGASHCRPLAAKPCSPAAPGVWQQ
jgi:hypothetical protein